MARKLQGVIAKLMREVRDSEEAAPIASDEVNALNEKLQAQLPDPNKLLAEGFDPQYVLYLTALTSLSVTAARIESIGGVEEFKAYRRPFKRLRKSTILTDRR